MKYYLNMWKQWDNFSGSSSRREFWMAWLINFLIIIPLYALIIIAMLTGITIFIMISSLLLIAYGLAVFLPFLALEIRRLHDINLSGWVYLISLIPVGGLILLLFFCMDGRNSRKYIKIK